MKFRLRKIGNSNFILIPSQILKELGKDTGDEIEISFQNTDELEDRINKLEYKIDKITGSF